MQTVVMCSPDEFCCYQKETGGMLPQAPLEIWCMAEKCPYPEKQCIFVQKGGVRK